MALDNWQVAADNNPNRANSPARDLVILTKGAGALDEEVRAILVTVAGTINLVTSADRTVNAVPVVVGWNSLRLKELLAGGTATGLFGVL